MVLISFQHSALSNYICIMYMLHLSESDGLMRPYSTGQPFSECEAVLSALVHVVLSGSFAVTFPINETGPTLM